MQDLCTGLWAHAQLNFIRLVQAASASDLPSPADVPLAVLCACVYGVP